MSSTSKVSPVNSWIHSLTKAWNVSNFHVTDDPYWTATFTVPGLSHESFDMDGNPKITSIMQTSSISRVYALHKPDDSGQVFLDWPTLTHDKFTFMSSTEYKMSKALYDRDVPKWPLDVKFSLGFVGNSSVCNVAEFFQHGDDKEPLWTSITQVVSVDKKTRKPTALPDWFKDKYKGKGCRDKGLIIKAFERPAVTYCHPVYVNWSDTDVYKHTNFASYAKFAVDSLHAAIRNEAMNASKPQPNNKPTREGSPSSEQTESMKSLIGISKDTIRNGLKDIQIVYLSECLEGECLEGHVWQNDGPENVVWCAIERDGKDRDVCHLMLEYFHAE